MENVSIPSADLTSFQKFQSSRLPDELIQHIFSYLLHNIEDLKQPWRNTCYLARSMMETGLSHYCAMHGLNYFQIKQEYENQLSSYNQGVLSLADMVQCAVVRHWIQKIGSYELSFNFSELPYIPKIIYQFSRLPSSISSTEEIFEMAFMTGNTKLCLSLLSDTAIQNHAKGMIHHLVDTQGALFLYQKGTQLYESIFPWEIIDSALIQSFVVCYQYLTEKIGVRSLPSKQMTIQSFLTSRAFIFIEQLTKAWGLEPIIPFAEQLLFHLPFATKKSKNWHPFYEAIIQALGPHQRDSIVKNLYHVLRQTYQLSPSEDEANWLLHYFKNHALFPKIYQSIRSEHPIYVEANKESRIQLRHILTDEMKWLLQFFKNHPIFSQTYQAIIGEHSPYIESNKESRIQLRHILSGDASYLSRHDSLVSSNTLLSVLAGLHFAEPSRRLVVIKHFNMLLPKHAHYFHQQGFLIKFLNAAAKAQSPSIIEKSIILIADPQKVFSILHCLKTDHLGLIYKILNRIQLLSSKDFNIAQLVEKKTIPQIQGLLDANLLTPAIEWNLVIQDFLAKDNHKKHDVLHLCNCLLTQKMIQPNMALAHSLWKYSHSLLEFIYYKVQYTTIDLIDILQLQWTVLENVYSDISHTRQGFNPMLELMLQGSFQLLHQNASCNWTASYALRTICNPFRLHGLPLEEVLYLQKPRINLLSNAFRLKALELSEIFFLKKQYPTLLKHLSQETAKNHVTHVLSLFGGPAFWVFLKAYAIESVHQYLEIACELIRTYRIQNKDIVQCYQLQAMHLNRGDLLDLLPKLSWDMHGEPMIFQSNPIEAHPVVQPRDSSHLSGGRWQLVLNTG